MNVKDNISACLGYRITQGFIGFDNKPNQPEAINFYSMPIFSAEPEKAYPHEYKERQAFEAGDAQPKKLETIEDLFSMTFDLSTAARRNSVANKLMSLLNVQV